jgi:hypothetical protein
MLTGLPHLRESVGILLFFCQIKKEYHIKVRNTQKYRQNFSIVLRIAADLSLCFQAWQMSRKHQSRQNFLENPAKLILNPHTRYKPGFTINQDSTNALAYSQNKRQAPRSHSEDACRLANQDMPG